ncbi:hypothetical protein [Streptomyces prunicolor]
MTSPTDDDEKTVRAALIAMGVGPNGGTQPAIPPMPPRPPAAPPPRQQTPPPPAPPAVPPVPPPPKPSKPSKPTAPTQPPRPKKPQISKAGTARKRKRQRAKRRNPDTPRSAWDTEVPDPRQSLLDAWAAVPYRLKWLGYHLAAAYLGWMVGLVGWATYVTTWIATTGPVGGQAVFWYAAAGATLLLHRRTRGWWGPVAFLAAVPASSTVVGVLLYGTPHP